MMVKLLSITGLLALIVHKFTLVHPYLLADNRYVNHMHLLYMAASLVLRWTADLRVLPMYCLGRLQQH